MTLWQKMLLKMVLDYLARWLTAEKIEEGKVELVRWLRALAKSQTPDLPFDDQVVEIVARALKVA